MGGANEGSALDGLITPIALLIIGLWLLFSWIWAPLFFIGIALIALIAAAIWWTWNDI